MWTSYKLLGCNIKNKHNKGCSITDNHSVSHIIHLQTQRKRTHTTYVPTPEIHHERHEFPSSRHSERGCPPMEMSIHILRNHLASKWQFPSSCVVRPGLYKLLLRYFLWPEKEIRTQVVAKAQHSGDVLPPTKSNREFLDLSTASLLYLPTSCCQIVGQEEEMQGSPWPHCQRARVIDHALGTK